MRGGSTAQAGTDMQGLRHLGAMRKREGKN